MSHIVNMLVSNNEYIIIYKGLKIKVCWLIDTAINMVVYEDTANNHGTKGLENL